MSVPIGFGRTPRDGGVTAALVPPAAPAPDGHGAFATGTTTAPDGTSSFRSMLSAALDSPLGDALEHTRDRATRDAASLRRTRLMQSAGDSRDARDARMDATTAAESSRRTKEHRELSGASANDAANDAASTSAATAAEARASDADDAAERDAAEKRAAAALARQLVPNDGKAITDAMPAGNAVLGAGIVAADASDTVSATIGETGVTHRRLDALVPEMRDRLQRVIDRMEADYGYTVEVVETVRSQERQDALFAQGRTAPGNVVTWTRNSHHIAGKAADVTIDGTYQNAAGFERLARVAREEGLSTLWPRDPGHIQLASSDATQGGVVAGARGGDGRILPMPGMLGGDATTGSTGTASMLPGRLESGMARVAQVAQVASVAEVARVAQPGAAGSAPSATIVAAPAMSRESTSERGNYGASEQRSFASQEGDKERADTSVTLVTPRDGDLSRLLAGGDSSAPFARASAGGEPVAGLAHTDASERIARMLSLQDAAAERPMSSLLLRLDHPEGGEDRIRIDMRGQSVGATFDVSDPQAADHLRAHTRELQQALQRQGLEGDTMVVRTSTRSTEPAAHLASALAAERDVLRAGSASAPDGGSSTAKDSRNQPRAEDGREDKDHQRSRQRRDQKGER